MVRICWLRYPTSTDLLRQIWDPFIERSLDVLVPVVEDRDLAFWDDRKRQVLKIHGCITRPHSIVATEADYNDCISHNPLIFNKLRDLMATKTFVFMGYSMRDSDFQEVWSTITKALGRFAKLGYAIDPKATEENINYWGERGIQLVKTSDITFLRSLREKLEAEDFIPSRKFLDLLRVQRNRILSIHVKLQQSSDGAMASSMYQDGLLHMLDDILSSTMLGMKRSQDYESELAYAAKALRTNNEHGEPIETAYWSGRHEVLKRFCSRDKSSIPALFSSKKAGSKSQICAGPNLVKARQRQRRHSIMVV